MLCGGPVLKEHLLLSRRAAEAKPLNHTPQ